MSGKNHPSFKGYYITPKINSAKKLMNDLIGFGTINRWCKNSNKVIHKTTLGKSKYLQSLNESPLGKTFKDLGFGFILNLPS